jgi:hypothetical protein
VDSIVVRRRFNGPADSGNGGYTCGLVAKALGAGPAEVRLKAPPPLDRGLVVERSESEGDVRVEVRDGETLVAEGWAATVDVDPPPLVSRDDARAAAPHGPFVDAETHPYPRCFVCGPLRDEGDGLRIFAGPVGGNEVMAAEWTPPAELAGADGALPEEMVWAGLDCPSSGPVANDGGEPGFKPIVLGSLAVRVDRPVISGEPHVVVAKRVAVDGRKRHSSVALYTDDGELCAVGRALWIELRSA